MKPPRFLDLAARFSAVRVVVLGDVMLDRYLEGPVERVSPEAPVPVVRVENEWDAAGGAGNVAANVRTLGARCDLIGVVAPDEGGRTVRRALEARGVDLHLVSDGRRPTTVKTRVLARGQQVVRVDRERDGPVSDATQEALRARLDERLPNADFLVLADYNKGVLSPACIRHSLDAASTLGVPAIVDPKRRNFLSFGGATVFKPNRSELEGALGEPARPFDVEWMEGVRRRAASDHFLLTLGDQGMVLASPGGVSRRVRVRARSVYDVSGAGDTVTAVVAVSSGAGAAMVEAVHLAAHAAAVGVGKVGVATVTPSEIEASLKEERPQQ